MNTKILSATLLLFSFLFFSACNSGEKTTASEVSVTNDSATDYSVQLETSEKMKASIEATAAVYAKKEIVLVNSDANEALRQAWSKMDVYSDSSGIRKIKLYPHSGISQRSIEYYYNKGKMFFCFISDSGLVDENKDEGKPGKEFHFINEKLIKYDDKSGDKESNPVEEKKMYELKLPLEAEELYAIARNSSASLRTK